MPMRPLAPAQTQHFAMIRASVPAMLLRAVPGQDVRLDRAMRGWTGQAPTALARARLEAPA